MRIALPLPGLLLLAAFGVYAAQQNPNQEKPKENPPAPTEGAPKPAPEAAKPATEAAKPTAETAKPAPQPERKNPIKPTPEGLAEAKKIYGYDCAMCHGANGDGKGDLVSSMNLTMRDLRDPTSLVGMSDGELFDLIQKGKDKMVGEGDRVPPERIWGLVNYVRSLSKKNGAEKPQNESSKP
jgi:mono/diheme cytochrome c family protein